MAELRRHASIPQGLAALDVAAERVRDLRGLQRTIAAAAAGAVSILAMAPFHASPILLLTLPMLAWLLEGCARQTASGVKPTRGAVTGGFAIGWAFGFGYHLVGLFWIGEAFLVEADVFAWLLPFAVTGLPAAMAVYWGLAGAAVAAAWQRNPRAGPVWRITALAVALGLAEWLRGHLFTGFPWNVLGYALTQPLVLMQSAGLVGIYGLTVLTVLIFAIPLVVLADAARGGRPRAGRTAIPQQMAGLPLAILAALTLYGLLRLQPQPPPVDGVLIRIVQPSIPQRQKWRPELQRRFFEEHLALSGGPGDTFDGITHVVWPEASMPFGPLRSPEALRMIADRVPADVTLIAGALRAGDVVPAGADRPSAYNSLLAFGAGGSLAVLYDKIHLVPFGEYLPFQTTLEAIGLEQLSRMRGGFSSGVRPRPVLAIPGLPPTGVLICYEAIFPAAVVQGAVRPGMLINITNDGWFGNTTGPRQHFHQSRVRAVEEGVSLLRAANNGISGLIDPYGRVVGRIDLDVRGVLDVGVPRAAPAPAYSRFGDTVFFAGLALAAAALVAARRRARAAVHSK